MSNPRQLAGMRGIVRKLVLSEGSPVVIPSNSTLLKSEVVVDDDDEELLLVWLVVPEVSTVDTSSVTSNSGQVIYTNTTIYDDDFDEDFGQEIEDIVNKNLSDYGIGWDDDSE